mmetsp:Transcript_18704/g.52869  ORF Transcript_18704/g.52869 Transcript_18704/m.52869 type:complete len:98 (+) Transcript_18704:1023-1316(+)
MKQLGVHLPVQRVRLALSQGAILRFEGSGALSLGSANVCPKLLLGGFHIFELQGLRMLSSPKLSKGYHKANDLVDRFVDLALRLLMQSHHLLKERWA